MTAKSTDVNIAFIIDDSFLLPLSVAIRSALNSWCFGSGNTINIYVLGLKLSESSKTALQHLLATYDASLCLHIIDCALTSCPLEAKMLIPHLIPSNVSILLYLDADVLIRADLTKLWELASGTSSLAAVYDVGVAKADYFNAGLMVLNLDYMREAGISEKMMEYYRKEAPKFNNLLYKEQDIYNMFFPKWEKLSIYWNAQGLGSYAKFRIADALGKSDSCLLTESQLADLEKNAYLVHFTGSAQPRLFHFNSNFPEPSKPWSGMVLSPETSELKPYVEEWFRVLHSIPTYRDWIPPRSQTEECLQRELTLELNKADERLQGLLLSESPEPDEDRTLAVLLPLTSKHSEVELQLKGLKALVNSFPTVRTRFYVGIDDNDPMYAHDSLLNRRLMDCFENYYCKVSYFPPDHPPNICGITKELARMALADKCFYFLLLGDDVKVKTPKEKILSELHSSFSAIAQKTNTPFGFGCVAFHDETSLGFPTFPVVTRVHFDIFDGEWCPPLFVNQDADPYLFEVYRKYYAAKISHSLVLRNEVGGADTCTPPTRYDKQHVLWKDSTLAAGIQQVARYFADKGKQLATCIRLDVVVPSYRVQLEYLQSIIELPVPPNCSTTFIIILDNPDQTSHRIRKQLEEKYRDKVRIRVNSENRGASYTRSRGLDESAADWILFLDDDVIPSLNLLYVYVEEIVRTGERYAGYVGATDMPEARTVFTKGIQLAHLLHFWSNHVCSGRQLAPWGITAQLALRRTTERFNEVFPKTGGGEDIDLCLRTCRRLGLPLKNLPQAKCCHPWWNEGKVQISRFLGWAKGDSYLVDLYPEHCFRSYPNGLEMILFVMVAHLGLALFSYYSTTFEAYSLLESLVLSIMIILMIDIVFELCHIKHEEGNHRPELQGIQRMWCGLVGICFYRLLGADVGHVLYPILRGSICHLCLRFDWWCGLYPEDVKNNRNRERLRFFLIAMCLSFWVFPWHELFLLAARLCGNPSDTCSRSELPSLA